MPKDNFGNESRFNENAGNKKPLKKLVDFELPNIGEFSTKSNKEATEVSSLSETPKKLAHEVNSLSSTPQKTAQDVDVLSETPDKVGVDVDLLKDTPEKEGQNVNPLEFTSEKEGQNVNLLESTPEKTTIEISPFSNLNKLENEGISFDSFITPNLSNVDDLSPVNDSDLIKPFVKSNLSGLDKFSPTMDNDKIGEVDFFDNTHAPGFIKDFQGPSKYIEDSSDKDLPGDSLFTPVNKYEDHINSLPNGDFGNVQSNNSSNPLLQGHIESIGKIGEPVLQEVDFLSQTPGNWGKGTLPLGFTRLFSPGDGSLLIDEGVDSALDELLDYRIFDFSNDIDPSNPFSLYENYKYDPRTPRIGVPSHTQSGITQNIYLGSALDNLSENNNNPDEKYIDDGGDVNTGDGSTPFTDDSDGDGVFEKLFNSRNYDFRQQRNVLTQLPSTDGVLGASGQRVVKFYNEPHSYLGSTFDDLLVSQISPFVSGLEDHTLLSQYIGLISGAPYINLSSFNVDELGTSVEASISNEGGAISKYDDYYYDPRVKDRQALFNITHGQPFIKFYNPQNPYKGSIFDDPLINGILGGGVFNDDEANVYSSEEYKGNPFPSMKEIAEEGNFGSAAPGTTTTITSFVQALNAIEKYETTSLLNFPLTELGTDLPHYYDGPIITGEGLGLGNINLSNSSWWFGGGIQTGVPLTNVHVESSLSDLSFGTMDTRTISISGSALTSHRLGFGDLTFDTIYNSDHTSNYDLRLDMRYTTLLGPRGEEPYIITPIPDNSTDSRTDSFLFDTEGITATGFSPDRGDRISTDKSRFESYFNTNHGEVFLQRHEINFRKNARSYRGFRRSAVERSLEGKLGTYSNVKNLIELDIYTGTVYESLLRPFGLSIPYVSHPGEISNTILLITNTLHAEQRLDDDGFGIPFLGGVAYQTLGLNKLGLTFKTNVTPTTLENLLYDNINNAAILAAGTIFGKSALQTEAGGMSEFTNPRFLGYEQKLNGYLDDTEPLELINYNEIPDNTIGASLFGANETYSDKVGSKNQLSSMNAQIIRSTPVEKESDSNSWKPFGDFMNMILVRSGETLDIYGTNTLAEIESSQNGYPFYFKDLRDNKYIFFRGYIYGLTEQITPRWGEEIFLGRSEPIYNYESTTRDITFTLKLAAQSRWELDMIYDKLDRLASLCYPQYKVDDINFPLKLSVTQGVGKVRPKPPLTKFRVAELFGSKDNELTGFIKSLSNVYPDTNQWETENGNRVPLYIESNITYQVIHKTVPDYTTKFYGKDSILPGVYGKN